MAWMLASDWSGGTHIDQEGINNISRHGSVGGSLSRGDMLTLLGFISFQIEERGHKADPSDVCKSTLYFLDIFPYQVGLFESPKENII